LSWGKKRARLRTLQSHGRTGGGWGVGGVGSGGKIPHGKKKKKGFLGTCRDTEEMKKVHHRIRALGIGAGRTPWKLLKPKKFHRVGRNQKGGLRKKKKKRSETCLFADHCKPEIGAALYGPPKGKRFHAREIRRKKLTGGSGVKKKKIKRCTFCMKFSEWVPRK